MRPLIGISCCIKPFGIFGTPNHAASDSYVRVVRGPMGGTPVLLPAAGEEAAAAAGGAGGVRAVTGKKDADVHLVGLGFHPVEEAFDTIPSA